MYTNMEDSDNSDCEELRLPVDQATVLVKAHNHTV